MLVAIIKIIWKLKKKEKKLISRNNNKARIIINIMREMQNIVIFIVAVGKYHIYMPVH